MAKKNQKFNKYTDKKREKLTKLIVENKKSYDEVAQEYNVPKGTLAGWVKKYRETGSLKAKKRGRPKKKKTDKDRIKELEMENEILKNSKPS